MGEGAGAGKDKSPSGSATINLRRHAIIRALSNLIDNAAKFAGVIHLGLDLRRNNVVFRIEDDGPGIPASDHEKALRPFERLDLARNQNKSTGTGLGPVHRRRYYPQPRRDSGFGYERTAGWVAGGGGLYLDSC